MKTPAILPVAALLFTASFVSGAESERTAEHVLTTPSEYEGKEVTLDVAFVKPVHWKSPAEEFAFFHAITMDRNDLKRGGEILVAIPAAEAAAFAKKYGTDFEGRYEKDTLTGTLLASPGRGRKGKVWFVDTTGKIADLIKQNKVNIDEEGGAGGGEEVGAAGGPGGDGGAVGPRWRGHRRGQGQDGGGGGSEGQ